MKAEHESERWMLNWLQIKVCWDLWINLGKAIWAETNQLAGRIGKVVLRYPKWGFVPSDPSLTIKRKWIKAWQQEPEAQLISVVHATEIHGTTRECQDRSVKHRSVQWFSRTVDSKDSFSRHMPANITAMQHQMHRQTSSSTAIHKQNGSKAAISSLAKF